MGDINIMSDEKISIGTRIRFTYPIVDYPNEHDPLNIHANVGDKAEIVGYSDHFGYWAKKDGETYKIKVKRVEFELIKP